jgi:hypothetical protein
VRLDLHRLGDAEQCTLSRSKRGLGLSSARASSEGRAEVIRKMRAIPRRKLADPQHARAGKLVLAEPCHGAAPRLLPIG